MQRQREPRSQPVGRSLSVDDGRLSSSSGSDGERVGSSGQGKRKKLATLAENGKLYAVEADVESFKLFPRPRSVLLLLTAVFAIVYVAYARQNPSLDVFGIGVGNKTARELQGGMLAYGSGALDPKRVHLWKPEGEAWQGNILTGFKAVCCMMMVIAAVSFPDGPFTRPHPMFWRLILGLLIIYWCVMIFVLFLDYQEVRFILAWLDPERLMPERYGPDTPLPWVTASFLDSDDYGTDCSTTWENVSSRYCLLMFQTSTHDVATL